MVMKVVMNPTLSLRGNIAALVLTMTETFRPLPGFSRYAPLDRQALGVISLETHPG